MDDFRSATNVASKPGPVYEELDSLSCGLKRLDESFSRLQDRVMCACNCTGEKVPAKGVASPRIGNSSLAERIAEIRGHADRICERINDVHAICEL